MAMPLYDYGCRQCHHRWEETRIISRRDDPSQCPECGAIGKRIFIGTPIIPWYPDTTRSPYKERRRHH